MRRVPRTIRRAKVTLEIEERVESGAQVILVTAIEGDRELWTTEGSTLTEALSKADLAVRIGEALR